MKPSHSRFGSILRLALILLLASGNLSAIDVWDQASPNDDTPANTRNVLIPGDPPQRHDVEAKAGPTADQDWFRVVVVTGHSYEVRVGGLQGNTLNCLGLFGPRFRILESDGTTEITTGSDLPGTGAISSFRAVFVAPTSLNVFVQLIGDTTCTATSQYTIQVFDTTLFNTAWSTNSVFDTFFALTNVCGTDVTGVLTLINTAGVTVTTVNNVLIPSGSTFSTNTLSLGTPRNQVGGGRFANNNNSAGCVIGEAAIASFQISPPFLQPVKFEVARGSN